MYGRSQSQTTEGIGVLTTRFTQTTGSSQLEDASCVIVGVPFNGSYSYHDSPTNAPDAIRTGSPDVLMYSYSSWQRMGCAEETVVCDVGNLVIPLSASTEDMASLVCSKLSDFFTTYPVVLGGDHSISYPALKAAADKHGELEVVTIDAHHDCFLNEASEPLTHGNWLAHASNEGYVDLATVCGVRTSSIDNHDLYDEYGVRLLSTAWSTNWSPDPTGGPLWLSVDLDGFDPSTAPGVVVPEPGGFTAREGLELIARVLGTGRVVGGDIVECWPSLDSSRLTVNLAHSIVREFVVHFSNREDNPWQ